MDTGLASDHQSPYSALRLTSSHTSPGHPVNPFGGSGGASEPGATEEGHLPPLGRGLRRDFQGEADCLELWGERKAGDERRGMAVGPWTKKVSF